MLPLFFCYVEIFHQTHNHQHPGVHMADSIPLPALAGKEIVAEFIGLDPTVLGSEGELMKFCGHVQLRDLFSYIFWVSTGLAMSFGDKGNKRSWDSAGLTFFLVSSYLFFCLCLRVLVSLNNIERVAMKLSVSWKENYYRFLKNQFFNVSSSCRSD